MSQGSVMMQHEVTKDILIDFRDYVSQTSNSMRKNERLQPDTKYQLFKSFVDGLLDAGDLLPYIRKEYEYALQELPNICKELLTSDVGLNKATTYFIKTSSITDTELMVAIESSRLHLQSLVQQYEKARGLK